jgi:hypothetical protein
MRNFLKFFEMCTRDSGLEAYAQAIPSRTDKKSVTIAGANRICEGEKARYALRRALFLIPENWRRRQELKSSGD